tara:strand:+ start:78 stop:458 length:381 start_codon:yes stop_codon:yes gene_type:complete
MTITEKYLDMILPTLAVTSEQRVVRKVIKGLHGYAFPCPFCQFMCEKDSSRNKRCAYLIPHKESFSYTFMCHRHKTPECQTSRSFSNFLAMYNPDLYKKYQMERFHAGTTGKGHNLKNPKFNKKEK